MTEQKFRTRIKIRIFIASLLLLTGVGLVIFTVMKQGGIIPDDAFFEQSLSHNGFFAAGYHYGVSIGITFSALATIIKNIVWLVKKESFNKQYIKETDERNKNILQKAMVMSWLITLYTILVASFLVPADALIILLSILCASMLSFLISFVVIRWKM